MHDTSYCTQPSGCFVPEMPYISHAGTISHTHIVVIIIGGACISFVYVCVECALVCVCLE